MLLHEGGGVFPESHHLRIAFFRIARELDLSDPDVDSTRRPVTVVPDPLDPRVVDLLDENDSQSGKSLDVFRDPTGVRRNSRAADVMKLQERSQIAHLLPQLVPLTDTPLLLATRPVREEDEAGGGGQSTRPTPHLLLGALTTITIDPESAHPPEEPTHRVHPEFGLDDRADAEPADHLGDSSVEVLIFPVRRMWRNHQDAIIPPQLDVPLDLDLAALPQDQILEVGQPHPQLHDGPHRGP